MAIGTLNTLLQQYLRYLWNEAIVLFITVTSVKLLEGCFAKSISNTDTALHLDLIWKRPINVIPFNCCAEKNRRSWHKYTRCAESYTTNSKNPHHHERSLFMSTMCAGKAEMSEAGRQLWENQLWSQPSWLVTGRMNNDIICQNWIGVNYYCSSFDMLLHGWDVQGHIWRGLYSATTVLYLLPVSAPTWSSITVCEDLPIIWLRPILS